MKKLQNMRLIVNNIQVIVILVQAKNKEKNKKIEKEKKYIKKRLKIMKMIKIVNIILLMNLHNIQMNIQI